MLRTRLIRFIALAIIAAVLPGALLCPAATVRADDAADAANIISDAIACGAHRCNVNAPRSGKVFIQLYGTFDNTSVDTILNQINSYRLEACQSGTPDPRNPGRGLTMADYVPVRWSRGMQEMAMLRAAEASLSRHHLKTTGEDFWGSSYDVAATCEVLAYGNTIMDGLGLIYAERAAWCSGQTRSAENYPQLINPANTYVGMAGFNHTEACVFTNQPGIDESRIDVSVYNSQLAEVTTASISNVTVRVRSGSCSINSTSKLEAVCDISILSYTSRLTYTTVPVLATTWWSASPDMLTVDARGYATGKTSGMAYVYWKLNGISYSGTVRVNDTTLVRDFATRLYSVALGRTPDQAGLDYWTGRLANRQVTGTQAAYGFFFSDEFINSNLTNEAYIQRLYQTFLGRDPEPAGYNYWLTRMADGATRREVFYGFSGSAEFAGICAYAGITP